MYSKNELLFPASAIPTLHDACGETWRKLVDNVASLPEAHPESLALSLMMMKLDGCLECETDSYRAMRGCASCAVQTLGRFKGSDLDLLELYQQALVEIEAYLEEQNPVVRVA